MEILKIRELLPSFNRYTSTSVHENYAEINRTHRELHFLPSLATQLAKIATGELGEIGENAFLTKIDRKYQDLW